MKYKGHSLQPRNFLKRRPKTEPCANSKVGLFGVTLLVPEPRGAHNIVKLRVARLPAELADGLF